jgi:hypothetical protein
VMLSPKQSMMGTEREETAWGGAAYRVREKASAAARVA